ncbi:EH domain-containing protein 1-like isoform X2 [Pyrus x bretschneideri]|uniref:EH domain-containing protein 1-like isoform X2 n=1 Tax=Pyrus x bretschneideri TaxID=225117 RepID=UPI00202E0A2D|nr:EH domain-containing protein 1-like isoform X2 [Pyrus x bretschneideri]
MASAQSQSANLDLFDAYFRRADLDRDGQISGNEAVAFFQGSGLPKQTWAHADQRQTGFLGRADFILQLVRPISRHPEYQNWRNVM